MLVVHTLCCVPAFTTDGLRLYFYALTAHFGEWIAPEEASKPCWQVSPDLLYGQGVKMVGVGSNWGKWSAPRRAMFSHLGGRRSKVRLFRHPAGVANYPPYRMPAPAL